MILSELMRYVSEREDAVVNLEVRHPAFFSCDNLKLTADQYLHHGAYCVYAKLHGDFSRCGKNKRRSVEVASKGRCFHGVCPNGVWDLAYPVMVPDLTPSCKKLAAVVYVGHFRVEGHPLVSFPGSRFDGALPKISEEKIVELRKSAAFIAEFAAIEINRFIESGGLSGKRRDDAFYAENSRRYIDGKYRENITLKELADTIRMNPNYLGALLKRHFGKTFRDMLNERRVEEAKVYLRLHKHLTISKIALLCGFGDSNYFCVVFKRYTGASPSAWRN